MGIAATLKASTLAFSGEISDLEFLEFLFQSINGGLGGPECGSHDGLENLRSSSVGFCEKVCDFFSHCNGGRLEKSFASPREVSVVMGAH